MQQASCASWPRPRDLHCAQAGVLPLSAHACATTPLGSRGGGVQGEE